FPASTSSDAASARLLDVPRSGGRSRESCSSRASPREVRRPRLRLPGASRRRLLLWGRRSELVTLRPSHAVLSTAPVPVGAPHALILASGSVLGDRTVGAVSRKVK